MSLLSLSLSLSLSRIRSLLPLFDSPTTDKISLCSINPLRWTQSRDSTLVFILGPDETIRKFTKLYEAGTDARKALLPSPLGGSCQALEPDDHDRLRASQLLLGPMHHIDNKRYLAYAIVAGRPLGSIDSHATPQPRIEVQAQQQALHELIKTQLKSFDNAVLRIDLRNWWVSITGDEDETVHQRGGSSIQFRSLRPS